MNYRIKRLLVLYSVLILILIGVGYLIYISYFEVKPSCMDGIKNGFEEGVDCGGNCQKICTFKAEDINVNWARPFEVADGVYNIAASIENPNFNYALDIEYIVNYYNERNIDLGKKTGVISLEPLEKQIIFLPGIKVPGQKIKRVFFDKTKIFNLKKKEKEPAKVIVHSKEIIRENGLTRLKVIIKNKDFLPKRNLEITAVLFKKDGNVIDINRTYIDYVDKDSDANAYMTWPKEIEDEISNIKIFIRRVEI